MAFVFGLIDRTALFLSIFPLLHSILFPRLLLVVVVVKSLTLKVPFEVQLRDIFLTLDCVVASARLAICLRAFYHAAQSTDR